MRSRSVTPVPSGSETDESDSNSVKSNSSLQRRGVSRAWITYIRAVSGREKERYAEYQQARVSHEARVVNLKDAIKRAGKNKKTPENDEVIEFLKAKLAVAAMPEPPGADEGEIMRRMALDCELAKKLQEREKKKAKKAENLRRAKEISAMMAQKAKAANEKKPQPASDSDSDSDIGPPVCFEIFPLVLRVSVHICVVSSAA